MSLFACDTETTISPDSPEVYLIGGAPVLERPKASDCSIFRTVREFIDWAYTKDNGSVFFFHNLKFDYSYIYNCLKKDNYFNNICISKEIIVGLAKKVMKISLTRNGKVIHLQDSFIQFYQSLAAIAKTYNTKWNRKLKIAHTYISVPDSIPAKMLNYFKYDICILSEALYHRGRLGRAKLTTGADAKEIIKDMVNNKLADRLGKKSFNRVFPCLPNQLDLALRKYYQGGFVYANPDYVGKVCKDVDIYDINSEYPDIMRNCPLPIGAPTIGHGKPPLGRLFLVSITVDWCEVKENSVPWINTGEINDCGSKKFTEILTPNDSKQTRTLYMTNMELELFKRTYRYGIIHYNEHYIFKSSTTMFRDFIDEMMKIKETSKGAMRDMAKRFANTPSGKWGENPRGKGYISTLEGGVQHFIENPDEEKRRAFYLPVSIFTTAYGRCKIISTILAIGKDKFHYCDTDSIHAHCLPEETVIRKRLFPIHPTKIGAFKHENRCKLHKTLRAKRYAFAVEDRCGKGFKEWSLFVSRGGYTKPLVHYCVCAGLPSSSTAGLTVFSFKEGVEIEVLRGRQKPGGIVLLPTSIKV